jgi:Cd2+/Zn2+-exporting ATPase/Cu+-exporting ATPase
VPQNFSATVDAYSEVFVARNGQFLGAIVIADTTRPEARRAIEALNQMGIRSVLLTGDSMPVAAMVARELGISEVEAELLPEMKLARIKSLVTSGRVVAMVGDGINDAPALAEASVGVAMGSGTDVARESADVVLLGNDLLKFTQTLEIARWTRRIIWWNFAGTIGVDLVGIALASAGMLSPTLAAFIHVTSELAFILNSARLLPRTKQSSAAAEMHLTTESKSLAKAA